MGILGDVKNPPTLAETVDTIAPIILPMLVQYSSLSPVMQRYFRDNLDWMIREMPVGAARASKRAIEAAQALGISTLTGFWWHHQSKFDKGRKVLHWEHIHPISDLRNALLSLDPPDIAGIKQILMRYEIAWITKVEDGLLKRFKRENPHEEYNRAGIELIDLWQPKPLDGR